MRKVLAVITLLAMAGAGHAGVGLVYNSDVSVTDTNNPIVFFDNGSGGIAAGFAATAVLIRSLPASANTCYFDLKDTTATAADTALEPGGSLSFAFPATSVGTTDGWPGLGAICSSGQTATFRVTAMR